MRFFVCLMCVLLLVGGVFAQTNRGTITGTVTDPAGAVVPGAAITAKNVGTNIEYPSAATSTGNFTIAQLPIGAYNLSVSMAGFKTYVRQGIDVQSAATIRVDVRLEVGTITESVTVSADAPLLKTESGELSHNVKSDMLDELPVLSIGAGAGATGIRNPYAVMQVLPGTDWRPDASVRVNGTPGNTQALRVEGMDATNNMWQQMGQYTQQGFDAIQEFAVQTSNYAAEFGQAGSAVFNLTMKSGTNDLHGSAYIYNVNEAYNASYYNYQKNEKVRDRARRNDYGFTVGGPIYLPKVYDGRDKSFWFFTIEQYLQSTTGVNTQTVPTDAMRMGNFSAVKGTTSLGKDILNRDIYENTIYNWRTERTVVGPYGNTVRVWDPFPNNTIPEIDPVSGQRNWDPAALAIQSYMPKASGTSLTRNWSAPIKNETNTWIPSVKVDYSLSAKAKLSGYWSRNYSKQTSADDGLPTEISASVPTEFFSHTVRINFDYTIQPTMLLHIGVGMMHNVNNQFPEPVDIRKTFGIKTDTFAFPYIGGFATKDGGFSPTMGAVVNARLVNIKPTANPSLSWIKGNHSFKFGAEMIVESHPSYSETFGNNWYTFTASQTSDPSLADTSTILPGGTSIGFPYASFLTGRVGFGATNAPSRGHLGAHSFAFYAQDSWKITPKLTIDYGLRYDYQTYLKEQYGRWANFSPTTPNPLADGLPGAMIQEGSGEGRCNCDYAKIYPYAFGPRLGLAWQLAPKTVLRAGAGISYGRTPELGYLNYTLSNFAWFFANGSNPSTQLTEGPPFKIIWPDPNINASFPKLPFLDAAPVFIDHNAGRPPRIFQWSIGLQREIAKDLVIEASYIGNRGAWWQAGPLNDVNGLTAEGLKSKYGLDVINSEADRTLLTTPWPLLSPADQARFPLPFANFPWYMYENTNQVIRPFPQFHSINMIWVPKGRTWYDSMQIKVTKRYSHNFDLSYSFTWQKELTLGAETSYNLFATIAPQVSDPLNPEINKYISGLSRPLMNVLAASYTVPKVFATNKFVSQLLRDWQIGALLRYTSAQPIRVPDSSNGVGTLLARNSGANAWANRTGKPFFLDQNGKEIDINGDYDPATTLVLNKATWTEPPEGQFSTSTAYYNDFRGRRHPTENVSLARNFRFGKDGRMNLSIRAEFNNIFNRLFKPDPSTAGYATAPIKASNGVYTSGFGYMDMSSTAVHNGVRSGQLVARFTF